MCAATAAARGRSVAVLEHGRQPGRKIAISGGGRCNFTNLRTTPASFLSDNPDFCRSALARYIPADFVALVERHGIAWHEKQGGELFCDHSAREIVAMLLAECERSGAQVVLGCHVESVERSARREGARRDDPVEIAERAGGRATGAAGVAGSDAGGFRVETSRGTFECNSLVVATGGLSVP
ncbi:MAG: NAD(P)/FAD-dependent oxidoreductase, partial [Deltaproteobacteria bacterium]|nr:NAD(P)/FAD-dependent oxidoreductase [Deltaproteobacteria bacterium]